jgi:EAL and modified HD-GYP domain-containing signal transduction protein
MGPFGFRPTPDNSKNIREAPASLARGAVAPDRSAVSATHVFVGRQPILNDDQKIFAYELLFRDSATARGAQISDNLNATSQILINTFNNLGVERVLGTSLAFINVCADMLLTKSDLLELLPPDRVVLEILESVEPSQALVDRCRQLRSQGYRFALDDFVYRPEFAVLLPLSDYVKFDVRALGISGMAEQIQLLQGHTPRLLAEKVETQEEYRACRALRVHCFQGYYFARPETLSMKRIDPSVQHTMHIFNQVMNKAEPEKIEQEFKRDVALSFNLLRYINSVGFGLTKQVSTIKHALVLLGHAKLARWLSLLALSNPAHGVAPQALFRTALVRARMTELLGRRCLPPSEHDFLFMTGMFSLLDAMLETPLLEALKNLSLPDPVRNALIDASGPYAPFLEITRATETLDMDRVETLAGPVKLTLTDVTTAQMEAFAWAEQLSAPS